MNASTRNSASKWLALLALVVLALVSISCEENTRGAFLQPTGGAGEAFASRFSALQIVGDFNNWNAAIPSMEMDLLGTWRDTLTVQEGCYFMKIRTNDDWDESPDFGRCGGTEGDCQVMVPDDGEPAGEEICETTDDGSAIGQIEFLDTGSYEFAYVEPTDSYEIRRLTEVGSITGSVVFATRGGDLPEATVTILGAGTEDEVTSVTSSITDGAFLAEGLAAGTYDVLVQAAGFVEQLVAGVSVAVFETTDVGPVALVVGCTSLYSRVQLVGDFNLWDETDASDMTQVSDCLWSATIDVVAGCTLLKFRTDGVWGDDFGRCAGSEVTCPAVELTVQSDGTVLAADACAAAEPGALGSLEFLATGTYEVQLNEAAGQFTVRIMGGPVPTGSLAGTVAFSDGPGTLPEATISVRTAGTTTEVATTTSSATDGTWQVTGLTSGDYDLVFTATDYLPMTLTDVTVTPPGETAVATVTLNPIPVGSISGFVGFSDNPSPRPQATITLYEAGTTTVVGGGASSPADGAFAIADLLAGAYDLLITATGYVDSTVSGIDVVNLVDTGLGTIVLDLNCAKTLQIVGDFNSWDSDAPLMTSTGTCTWQATLAIPAGCYRLKLRTNGDWDKTPDYGRCSAAGEVGDCEVVVPDTGPVIDRLCRGTGLADAFGEVNFVSGGTYFFQFDETSGLFFIQRTGP